MNQREGRHYRYGQPKPTIIVVEDIEVSSTMIKKEKARFKFWLWRTRLWNRIRTRLGWNPFKDE